MESYYIDEKTKAVINIEIMQAWKEKISHSDILFLRGLSGFGKTLLAKIFAERYYSDSLYVACEDEEWEKKLRMYFKDKHDKRKYKLVIIDNLQQIVLDSKAMEKMSEIIISCSLDKVKFFIISRGVMPPKIKKYMFDKKISYIYTDELKITREQVHMLCNAEGIDIDAKSLESYMPYIGCPMAAKLWLEYVRKGLMTKEAIISDVKKDMALYWESTLENYPMSQIFGSIVSLSVYENFDKNMAEFLLGTKESEELFENGEMLTSYFQSGKKGTVYFRPIFLEFLRNCLKKRKKDEYYELYMKAGEYYENRRNILQALRCYDSAQNVQKVSRLLIYLVENADGSVFAKEGYRYIVNVSEDVIEKNPYFLSAKAMIYSYMMKPYKSNEYIEKLRHYVECSPEDEEALRAYIRINIAVPHRKSQDILGQFRFAASFFDEDKSVLRNLIPTGDQPSVLNGTIDFCPWIKDAEKVHAELQILSAYVLGKEGEGWADIFYGEVMYEKDRITEAISYLTKGISAAAFKGSIRMQFAGIGAMLKLFSSQNQHGLSQELLSDIRDKAESQGFFELIPNIKCMAVLYNLRLGNKEYLEKWLKEEAPKDNDALFISERLRIITKAYVLIALGRDYEALYILQLLESSAKLYNRTYFCFKISLLICILYYRCGMKWKDRFIETVAGIHEYGMYHIIIDEGAALLPLWNRVVWKDTALADDKKYISHISSKIKEYASFYPRYLEGENRKIELSAKEEEVLSLIAEGCSNPEISKRMNISINTVKKYVSGLMKKLGADNRAKAVKIGYMENLI